MSGSSGGSTSGFGFDGGTRTGFDVHPSMRHVAKASISIVTVFEATLKNEVDCIGISYQASVDTANLGVDLISQDSPQLRGD